MNAIFYIIMMWLLYFSQRLSFLYILFGKGQKEWIRLMQVFDIDKKIMLWEYGGVENEKETNWNFKYLDK